MTEFRWAVFIILTLVTLVMACEHARDVSDVSRWQDTRMAIVLALLAIAWKP